MTTLVLLAPLQGWASPLDEVPDAVFAQRMLGEGLAIDPTGAVLHAPCDGDIISVAKTSHAVTLRAVNGAEILLHVGLDTVALNGEGFSMQVTEGAHVAAGDVLMHFDLDLLAQRARSVLTPFVVTNSDRFTMQIKRVDGRIDVGDVILELMPKDAPADVTAQLHASVVDERLIVHHEHGIHARPAALIAAAAKRFEADVKLAGKERTANAKSAVALMSLGLRCGDAVTVTAAGTDAQQALAALRDLIGHPPAPASKAERIALQPISALSSGQALRGVVASRGYAVGQATHLEAPAIQVNQAGLGLAHETTQFERARAEVRARLQSLASNSGNTAREVISAHLEFLDDWELVAAARGWIGRGKSAGFAWRQAVRDSAETLKSLGDPRMAERVDDLLDLESQVLQALSGQQPAASRSLPHQAIVLADELKPSQLVALDATRIAGLCTVAGGATSHVAILAASMGVPALAAVGARLLEIPEGTWLELDAEQGSLRLLQGTQELAAAERLLAARAHRLSAERELAQQDCRTVDGTRIEVLANLGSVADAQLAVLHGAEGCGLLRTEFLFLDRQSPPDEHEQTSQYEAIARALGERPLTLRTLDVGGDKPLAYLPMPAEINPALGLRGVRTSLWRPDLLRTQLRAVLRISAASPLRILLPMITDVAEVRAVRALLDEIRTELSARQNLPLGVMIETPASALIAGRLAREVDFFSIGTNDLTQYTLAMDREHPDLAARMDGLHPSVLRLIAMTVQAAAACARPVAVCGGLASDPVAAPVLIGLGVRELSVVPSLIPMLKARVRTLALDDCCALARRALELDTAEAVRSLAATMSIAGENCSSTSERSHP